MSLSIADRGLSCFPKPSIEPGISSAIWHGSNPLYSPLSLLIVQLLLVLAITRVLYFILKPLKQPRCVPEIMGGIILGPSVLCRSTKFRDTIFPARGEPVLDTVAYFGLLFVIFLIGVKMDPGLVVRSGRKAIVVGLSGFMLPFTFVNIAGLVHKDSITREITNHRAALIFSVALSISITSFAVLGPIFSDLHLLNSELGRIALSASMTNDFIGWLFMTVFILVEASFVSWARSVSAFMSIVALLAFIMFVVRPTALWVIENTPPGKPVDEAYILLFLITILVVGFWADMIGTNTFHGALVLGLAIPDGPPLGAALSEKIEAIVSGILLPLYYIISGLNTDISSIENVRGWRTVQLMIFLGSLGKLVGILLPSLYFRIPFRDALSLSFFMNSKGIVEVITYNIWRNHKLVDKQSYSMLMLSNLFVTAIATPLATILYQPSRRYQVYKRRTVQHLRPDDELRILACIHDQSNVPVVVNLLEASYATVDSQIAVYSLHLVELIGRAAPIFIPHLLTRTASNSSQWSSSSSAALASSTDSEHIINAFCIHQQRHRGAVTVHPFTTISPYSSMHDEICRLAIEKRTSLVILPFHKTRTVGGGFEVNYPKRKVNLNVLSSAPCSVGILVDGTSRNGLCTLSGEFSHNVMVFFFGGEDDREALAYAARMASHPGVTLTVVRFLPSRSIPDNQAERRLDVRLIDEVRLMSAKNKRVVYREALVGDVEEIIDEVRILDESCYDLVMVGMRHRSNTVLPADGMAEWSECPELGVIGDYLSSSDFQSKFSVLIVMQQEMKELNLSKTGDHNALKPDEHSPP